VNPVINMRRLTAALVLLCASFPASAELTSDQKISDFLNLAGVFAKRYAFLEWKQKAFGYNGLDIAPWLAQVRETKTDLEFFDLCAKYVAGFQDSHIAFILESSFYAYLPISADIYSGKIVIDSIDRKALPEKSYPFQVGDEVVSINAAPVKRLFDRLTPVMGNGNMATSQRFAADALFYHDQAVVPDSSDIKSYANVETVDSKGVHQVRTLKWSKFGLPYTNVGPVPSPSSAAPENRSVRRTSAAGSAANPVPVWAQHLKSLRTFRLPRERFLTGFDDLQPFFAMPAEFKQRLGGGQFDFYFTGTFPAGGHTIGFLRIRDFGYADLETLQSEIQFMEANTDALVVDVTRNPGGDACAVQDTASYLIPKKFQALGSQIRATWDFVLEFEQDVEYAQYFGATADEIKILKQWASNIEAAYKANRGFTKTIPICGFSSTVSPATDKSNAVIAYTKPILLLTDNLSASAAELFAATMQDNQRSTQFGTRTMGAGGAVFQQPLSTYMDAAIYLPEIIAIRSHKVQADGLPSEPYIENFGVQPDIEFDYQTLDNLTQQGKPFVDGFTKAVVNLIPASPGK
jgi:peptidase S41-like protein